MSANRIRRDDQLFGHLEIGEAQGEQPDNF